jgi:hypothetical protein
MDTIKKQMLQNYLQQQNINTPTPSGSVIGDTSLVVYNDPPENITLEEFKNYVKRWLDCDNFIKKAQEAIKEKRKYRDKLNEVITKFMVKYNIEDLNTKEGRIRCKQTYKVAPVNQKIIKERITDYFSTDIEKKNEILSKVFENREKIEQVSLRRLKIS